MMLQSDHDRLSRLVSSMRTSIALLGELAGLGQEAFIADAHKISSAKYNFIAAIESAIDIANHLIARNKLRAPVDYGDTFTVLAEASVFDTAFSVELVKMARFRNRLVHMYWDIDHQELYTILKTRLGDFERFLSAISSSLALRQGQ